MQVYLERNIESKGFEGVEGVQGEGVRRREGKERGGRQDCGGKFVRVVGWGRTKSTQQ